MLETMGGSDFFMWGLSLINKITEKRMEREMQGQLFGSLTGKQQ